MIHSEEHCAHHAGSSIGGYGISSSWWADGGLRIQLTVYKLARGASSTTTSPAVGRWLTAVDIEAQLQWMHKKESENERRAAEHLRAQEKALSIEAQHAAWHERSP